MNTYYLIDNTKLFSVIFTSCRLEDVLHELLSQINDSLNFLIRSKIQIDIAKVEYSNFYCLEVIPVNNKPHPFITNIYKFDINKLHFYDTNNTIIDIAPSLNLIYDEIKSNMIKLHNITYDTKYERPHPTKSQKSLSVIRPMNSKITEKSLQVPNVIVRNENEDSKDSDEESDDEKL